MREHLVAYEYGTGAVWGVVMAASAEQVAEHLPEVAVYTEPPEWMTDDDVAALRHHALVDLGAEGVLDRLFAAHRRIHLSIAS